MFIIKESAPNQIGTFTSAVLYVNLGLYTTNRTWKLYLKMYNLRSDDTEKEMKKRNLVEINFSRLAWAYY